MTNIYLLPASDRPNPRKRFEDAEGEVDDPLGLNGHAHGSSRDVNQDAIDVFGE